MDAIHYKVREDKQIVNKAAYIAVSEEQALYELDKVGI